MKPIKVQNISLNEFKELLNRISARTLNVNSEFYYKEHIQKDKLYYLTFYLPTKEYVFANLIYISSLELILKIKKLY